MGGFLLPPPTPSLLPCSRDQTTLKERSQGGDCSTGSSQPSLWRGRMEAVSDAVWGFRARRGQGGTRRWFCSTQCQSSTPPRSVLPAVPPAPLCPAPISARGLSKGCSPLPDCHFPSLLLLPGMNLQPTATLRASSSPGALQVLLQQQHWGRKRSDRAWNRL